MVIWVLNDSEKIVCGRAHFLALSRQGCLYGWGDNQSGQLGDGVSQNSSHSPRKVSLLKILIMYSSY